MYDVFISYSTGDEKKAEKMYSLLQENGFNCWYAPRNIMGSEDFTEKIPRAINQSKTFLLLLSDNAQQSEWVHRELGWALKKKLPIFTYFLEDCKMIESYDFVLQYHQYYNFSLGQKEQKRRLMEELSKKLSDINSKSENTFSDEKVHTSENDKKASKKRMAIAVAGVIATLAIVAMFFVIKNTGAKGYDRYDGYYVIWTPKFNVALSCEPINTHYHAGEKVVAENGMVTTVSDDCIWYIDYTDENTFTISRNGQQLGTEPGYNGIGLADNYSECTWVSESADSEYLHIKNLQSGNYLNWYVQKNNWATHDEMTQENMDQFLIYMQKVEVK